MIFDYNDLKINYEIFEPKDPNEITKKPLLLLHGWMGMIASWAPVYNFFSKNRKVFVIDFPGQGGKSSTLTQVWGVPEYSAMTKSFIDSVGIKGCDVIGHSFGGRVIIYLASQYHDLFSRIILTDAAGVKPRKSIKKAIKIFVAKNMKWLLKIVFTDEKYEEILNDMRKRHGSQDYASLQGQIMRDTFNQVVSLDLTNRLKDITNSTLLIWGENDQDTPVYMAKIIEKNIKDSGIVIIENAGHFAYLDNTNKFLTVANVFI